MISSLLALHRTSRFGVIAVLLLAVNLSALTVVATPGTDLLRGIDDDERLLWFTSLLLSLIGAALLLLPYVLGRSQGAGPGSSRTQWPRTTIAAFVFAATAAGCLAAFLLIRLFEGEL